MPKITDYYGVQYQQCASPTNHGKHIWTRRVPGRKPEDVQFRCRGLVLDPYQEARLALRDVLGMEPDEQMIRNTMDTARQPRTTVKQAATLTIGAAKLADAEPEPAHEVAQTILIVTALGGETGSRLVVSADTTAGLARLRAHSALDALLDQHGISR